MPSAGDEAQGHGGISSTKQEMSVLPCRVASAGPAVAENKACSSPGEFLLGYGALESGVIMST